MTLRATLKALFETGDPLNQAAFVALIDGLSTTEEATIPFATATGLSVSDGDANRIALQTQWDAAATAGKALLIPAGTWPLTTTGSVADKRCLKPGDATKYYALFLSPGAILKHANSQLVDGATCITIQAVNQSGGLYVGWPFGGIGGTFQGNTANQAGWTLGYVQGGGHYAISVEETAASVGKNITIENVRIDDFFSNCIYMSTRLSPVDHADYYGSGPKYVSVRGVTYEGCGEGILLSGVNQFAITDCHEIRLLNKVAGDGVEPSFCRYGIVSNITGTTNGVASVAGGVLVDVYCSKYVTIDNVVSSGMPPFTAQSDFSDPNQYCDGIVASNIYGDGLSNAGGIGLIPSQGGSCLITNAVIKNFPTAAIDITAQAPVDGSRIKCELSNVRFENCGPAQVECSGGDITLNLANVWFANKTGIDFSVNLGRASGSAKTKFTWVGGGASNYAAAGLRVQGATFYPEGRIAGVLFDSVSSPDFSVSGGDMRKLLVALSPKTTVSVVNEASVTLSPDMKFAAATSSSGFVFSPQIVTAGDSSSVFTAFGNNMTTVSGCGNFSYLIGYQSNNTHAGATQIVNGAGFRSQGAAVNAGSQFLLYKHFEVVDMYVGSGAYLDDQYGLYIPALTGGWNSNWGVYSLTKSYFSSIELAASTAARAALKLTVGSAPTTPVDGDVWREDNTNTGLKIRVNGVTKTITLS